MLESFWCHQTASKPWTHAVLKLHKSSWFYRSQFCRDTTELQRPKGWCVCCSRGDWWRLAPLVRPGYHIVTERAEPLDYVFNADYRENVVTNHSDGRSRTVACMQSDVRLL